MSILITGSGGFIGSYAARDALLQNERVVSYDNTPDLSIIEDVLGADLVKKMTHVQGDLLDLPLMLSTAKAHKVDRIIHMASLQIPASATNPHLALRINCEGTLNIFELARILEVKKVVWASSSAVYGPTEKYGDKPVANDAPHYPTTVYGACKSLNERMATHYFDTYGLDSIGFRFTAVYGIGRVRGKSSFTTKMIEMAAYGKPYTVPFGDDLIDWQYIEDVSTMVMQALGLERKTPSRVFNTQGDVRPVVEGVKYLRTLAPDADLKTEPGKFGIPWRYDTSALEKEVGFKPRYSMEEGIKKTYEGFRSRRLLSHPR